MFLCLALITQLLPMVVFCFFFGFGFGGGVVLDSWGTRSGVVLGWYLPARNITK